MPAEAKVGLRFGAEGVADVLQQIGSLADALTGLGRQTVNPYNPALSTNGAPGTQGSIQQQGEPGTFSAGGYPAGMPAPATTGGPSAPVQTGGGMQSGTINVARADVINVQAAAVVNIYGTGGAGGGTGGAVPSSAGAPAPGSPTIPGAGYFVPGGVRDNAPPGVFNPDARINPGDWPGSFGGGGGGGSMGGATAPDSSGGNAGGPGRAPAWQARSPFQNYQSALDHYQQVLQSGTGGAQLQDARYNLDAAQKSMQSAQQQQNPTPEPEHGGGGGNGGLLGNLLRGYGAYQAASFLTNAVGAGMQYQMSGGDMTANRAQTNFLTSIPVLGSLIAPIAAPYMEKREQVLGAAAVRRAMGMSAEGLVSDGVGASGVQERDIPDLTLSPTYVHALEQAALMGIGLPQSVKDRFAITDPNDAGYVNPALRGNVLSTYTRLRRSPFGMSVRGFHDDTDDAEDLFSDPLERLLGNPGRRKRPASMGALAAATGDYESAMLLYGYDGDKGMQQKVRQWGTVDAQAQSRLLQAQVTSQYGQGQAGNLLAYGLTGESQGALFSNYLGQSMNLGAANAPIQDQLGVVREQMALAEKRQDLEAVNALRYRETQLKTQASGLQGQQIGLANQVASTPYTLDLQRNMSRTDFEIGVLNNIPGAYGNIRGAQMRQMQELQEAAGQVQGMRSQQEQMGMLTPQADFQYQQRLQQIGMQQSQTFSQLSEGWQNRLITTVIGNPGSFSLDGRGFSHRDAVMAGVQNAAMGSTRNQLPFFMRQAGLFDIPNRLPGVNMPFPSDESGVMGPGDPFSAGGGGAPVPASFPQMDGGISPGGHGAPADAPPGSGPGGSGPGAAPFSLPVPAGGGSPHTTGPGYQPRGPVGTPGRSAPVGGEPSHFQPGTHGGGSFTRPGGRVGQGYAPGRQQSDRHMHPGESFEDYVARRDAGLAPQYATSPTVQHIDGRRIGPNDPPVSLPRGPLPVRAPQSATAPAAGAGGSHATVTVVLVGSGGAEIGRGTGQLGGGSGGGGTPVTVGIPLSMENTLAQMGIGVARQGG